MGSFRVLKVLLCSGLCRLSFGGLAWLLLGLRVLVWWVAIFVFPRVVSGWVIIGVFIVFFSGAGGGASWRTSVACSKEAVLFCREC